MSEILYENPKWSKKFAKEMLENYNLVKQVCLDKKGISEKEQELIKNIEKILDNEKIENYKELNKKMNDFQIFKYNESADFIIRRGRFSFEEKTTIRNCLILFLFKEDNEFLKSLEKEFTNYAEYGKIKMKFSEFKWFDEDRKNFIETIQELLELGCKEDVLEEFFKDRVIAYSKEIGIAEISTLIKDIKIIGNPEIKGIILLFIAPEDVTLGTVTKAVEDVNFYIGAKEYTDLMYEIKIDKNCKKTKIKTIVVA